MSEAWLLFIVGSVITLVGAYLKVSLSNEINKLTITMLEKFESLDNRYVLRRECQLLCGDDHVREK
jgi:hypothetical protein